MVNICSHQAVVPPNDQRGQDATQYKAGISPRGLQIPLVVGRVRSCAVAGKASNTVAEGKAVDVLIHPWVMDQIQGEGPAAARGGRRSRRSRSAGSRRRQNCLWIAAGSTSTPSTRVG